MRLWAPSRSAVEGLVAEGRQSRRRACTIAGAALQGPRLSLIICHITLASQLLCTWLLSQLRIASSVMTNESRMCSDVRRRLCFRFPNGDGFVYFKGYNHNSSFSSACFVQDAL